MCQDPMCLSLLNPTRAKGRGGRDIFILKLISGSYLKSGEGITIVPLDTFWSGIRELVSSGAVPLISLWRSGSVEGLKITWPDLQNCTQLVLESDSIMKLRVRTHETGKSLGYETYCVPSVSEDEAEAFSVISLECEDISQLAPCGCNSCYGSVP